MPQLFSIAILKYKGDQQPPSLLCCEHELSSFSFFKRGTVQELVTFFIRQVVQRTKPGGKEVVEEGDYICHSYVISENLAAAVVTDKSYPTRVALSLCALSLSEFRTANGDKWANCTTDTQLPTPSLKELITKYQKPDEADNISRIQRELDEVKDILHRSMEDLLNRGEKLDSIIERSEDLSASSKQFLWQAKKTNQCCSYY
jgi:synaptobrevin family protein YKT6